MYVTTLQTQNPLKNAFHPSKSVGHELDQKQAKVNSTMTGQQTRYTPLCILVLLVI